MSSYLPPTDNAAFNPADWPTKADASAVGGAYLPITGGTLTGPLGGTIATFDTINADTIDATTTVEGDIITATQNGAARANTIATYNTTINPKSTSASGNSLVQLNDHVMLFSNGTNESGALTIGPFSATAKGMRMEATGDVTFQNNVNINGDVIIDQDLQVNGNITIDKVRLEEVLASNNTPITAALNTLLLNPNTSAGAALGANGLVQAGDSSLIFTQGTQNGACGLVVGPYTSTTRGFRMDGLTDVTTFSGGITCDYINPLNTTNPIILGASGSNTRTIIRSNNTTGGDIFINIPDLTPNTAQFVMSLGASTIAGQKTFSVAPNFTAASNQLGIFPSNGAVGFYITASAPAATRTYTLPDMGGDTTFLFTGGTQTIAAVKTFSAQPKMTAASNQIGIFPSNGANGFNINASAPAASRTYTLPDAGAAANFIMSEGANVFTSTARIDVPNQRNTLGSTATHAQKLYMFGNSTTGNRIMMGTSSTENRGLLTLNETNNSQYGLSTDIGDTTRMISLANTSTNGFINVGTAINFHTFGTSGNTARLYNDIFVSREVANQSTGQYLFNGFNDNFTQYRTMARIGWQNYSFIAGQGDAGCTLNSSLGPTTGTNLTGIPTKVMIGDGTQESTGTTYITGGLHCGGQLDIQKLNWRIPVNKSLAVTTAGAKTFAVFSPTFTSSSINFMIYVKFNLMVELVDPTRIMANNNMSSCMVTYTGTYYYNPSSSTQGLVDQDAVKQTTINAGANRTITAASVTITNSGTAFAPVFNLNITVGGASIGSSTCVITGDIKMDINSTSGYMTAYS